MSSTPLQQGLVVASHGRHLWVQAADGSRRLCHPRGKRNEAVVGDRVDWQASADEGRIERVHPRRNLLFRQDEVRTKAFAANIDQVLILLGARPAFAENLLARALVAAAAQRVPALIALNKRDLGADFDKAWERLAPYRGTAGPGTTMLDLCLRSGNDDSIPRLREALAGRVTLVLGPSGAGKSTLINRLVPDATAQTGELSQALQTGRHTTTHTAWYWVDDAPARGDPSPAAGAPADGSAPGTSHRTALIDSPGFQQFGLHHIEAAALAGLMPDIAAHVGQCRFYNCSHRHEPDCGIKKAVSERHISPERYQIYIDLHTELNG